MNPNWSCCVGPSVSPNSSSMRQHVSSRSRVGDEPWSSLSTAASRMDTSNPTPPLRKLHAVVPARDSDRERTRAERPEPVAANAFDASRRLFKRQCTVEAWQRDTEWRDVELLQYHLPSHIDGDLDRLAGALEHLSQAATMHADRYEVRTDLVRHHAAGLAVRLTSLARDVGALGPPPRPAATWAVPEDGLCPDWTPAARRDVPRIFRGPA